MANFRIYPISNQNPEFGKKYFFDANVWIYILDASTNPAHRPYIDFFNKLIQLIQDFDHKKTTFINGGGKISPNSKFDECNRPTIILTSMLVSEMFNVLTKKRFDEHQRLNPEAKFKRDFRGGRDHVMAVQSLRSELRSYQDYYTMINDESEEIDLNQLLDDLNYDMDMNDYIYYLICQNRGYIIVTNDGDYKVEFVDIYTERAELLSLT